MAGFFGLLELCGVWTAKGGGEALFPDELSMMSAGLMRTPGGSAGVDMDIRVST